MKLGRFLMLVVAIAVVMVGVAYVLQWPFFYAVCIYGASTGTPC